MYLPVCVLQMETLLMENQTLRTHRDSTMVDHMTNGIDEETQDSETELIQIRQIRPQIRPSSMIEMRDPNRQQLMQTVSSRRGKKKRSTAVMKACAGPCRFIMELSTTAVLTCCCIQLLIDAHLLLTH